MRLTLVLVVLVYAACDCRGKVLVGKECEGLQGVDLSSPGACESSSQCNDHFNCQKVNAKEGGSLMCCIFGDRKCTTEGECCQGQTCSSTRKICFDKSFECTADKDCGDKGDSFCEDWTDSFGTSKRCRLHTCGTLGECPEGQSCFNGECMAGLPCDGFCEAGKSCVPTTGQCQDYSMPGATRTDAACPMTCMPGYIATFKDARNLWDTCNLSKAKCVCSELPGLRSEDLGRFSALSSEPGKNVWASTYDGQYGDLAVYKFDLEGKLITGFPEYVDGVPAGATVKFGPHGARGGVVEPGDDVGRYSDIAVGQNGVVYVSYYDNTSGNLRFAWRNAGDGKWTTMRVDGADTDTGLYTSVAVDQDGIPAISYFQKGADSSWDSAACPAPAPTGTKSFITALKYAKATSQTPGPGDWTIKTLGCQSRPTPACYMCSNVCADPGSGPSCLMPGSGGSCVADGGASACDSNTETCVMVGATAQCAKKYNPSNLQDIPEGVGLFSALTFNGKEAFIAYQRRYKPAMSTVAKGDLQGVQITAAGAVGAAVVLDSSGDTGFFPDVKIDPSSRRVAVSYHDFSSKALKFYSGVAFAANTTPQIIDPGTGAMGSGENDWVGTDSAIVYGSAAGQLWVVYQDPTKGDLKLAKQNGGGWQVLSSLATMGAVGFFADGVFDNGKLFASHARIHAKLIASEPHVDNALLLEAVPAP